MRRYASYPTYSSVHPVGLISRVSGASGIGCRMRRYASYPTYSSVHPVGLISRVSGASGIGCRMRRYASYPTYSSVHPVGLISHVSGASGIGCRMRRHPSYPTYSSVHLVGLISRVSDASGIGCRIQSTGVFLFHLATGKQVVELLFVLVVVDAFVQLVAGLHGVDDAFLRAFLAQDVVDMFSGAVHGAER
ncbi:ribonucleoside diphosphage reductase 1 subunit beta, B2 [Escherichia coli]|nr:ribonucleoside diphosphage reductase 1 subunit beta, B2 [Escherichia coli]